jgi:hypothetical protein
MANVEIGMFFRLKTNSVFSVSGVSTHEKQNLAPLPHAPLELGIVGF